MKRDHLLRTLYLLGFSMVACGGDGAFEGEAGSESESGVGSVKQPAVLEDDELWPVVDGAVQVPFIVDEHISPLIQATWLFNMLRMQSLTRGRVHFTWIDDSTQAQNGQWLRVIAHHSNIGACGIGVGSPSTCRLRDSTIQGIGFLDGVTTTVYADRGTTQGTLDDLEGVFDDYQTLEMPLEPSTFVPLRVAAVDYQQDGSRPLVAWFEAGLPYRLYRSKGHYPDLDDHTGLAAVQLPAGLNSSSVLRGAAIRGDTVYTYWNVGSQLKVARGSSTSPASIEGLTTVTLPPGEPIEDFVDAAFDASGNLHSWFVKSYEAYGGGLRAPIGVRRYVGTYRDLDGAAADPGTDGAGIKTSSADAPLHELAHALGFLHEHQRSDRDGYVWVDSDVDTEHSDYAVRTSGTLHSGYDFASITHYNNGNVGRHDPYHTAIPGTNTLSWHDVTGLVEAYGLAAYTAEDAWLANTGDHRLGFSPLSGMTESDYIVGDYSQGGNFYAFYAFEGILHRSWGHEWDHDALGSSVSATPPTIGGAGPTLIGVAFDKANTGTAYAWWRALPSAACPSAVYRTMGNSADLDATSGPACVTVFGPSYDADDIVDIAIDNYASTQRVYTLYKDSRISIGSSLNLANVIIPSHYTLPDGLSISRVHSFALKNGTAVFHARGYRVARDPSFKNSFVQ